MEKKQRRPLLERIGGVAGVVATVVGAISGIVGLMVLLWPDADTPSSGVSAPPAARAQKQEVGGDLQEVALGPRLTARQYLREIDGSASKYSSAELRVRGQLVHFRVVTKGLADERALVLWSIRHRDGTLVSARRLRNHTGAIIRPLANRYTAEERIWVPTPRWSGEFWVELKLMYQGRELDFAQTDYFRGLGRAKWPDEVASPDFQPPTVTIVIGD